MLNYKHRYGFTLIEILIVVLIIGFMFSIVFSVSYQSYKKYRTYYNITMVVAKLKEARKESFLYSDTKTVLSEKGQLYIDSKQIKVDGCFFNIDKEIIFTKSGSEGGTVTAICSNHTYTIKILPPYGDIVLE